uniref:Outer membrane protein porin n=1 Tax=Tanacetum cinerariifolium TaxID=118510 RepID=A0A699HIC1_TANCI|nr:outer membrane protein porin [Tanacetum cinerariifolium]
MRIEELKSVNESLNLSVEELDKACAFAEATLRERDELVFAQCEKIRLLEEQSEPFYKVHSEFDSDIVLETQDNSEKDLILKLKTQIFITSSTFETKNLKLVKEMVDKVKCFDEEKKVFETKISKLEKVLAQRVKDFDNVKTKLSRRTDKFETCFTNLEKQNALMKLQLASQNYTLLQKENNNLRTSYNELKYEFDKKEHQVSKRIEKYKTYCEELEKENDDLRSTKDCLIQ